MSKATDMIGRLGLLAIALFVCVNKYLYTFTLELNTTGGSAAYILLLHDIYVIMTAWTVLLAVLVLTTGTASVNDMGKLKFLHSLYAVVMAAVATFSVLNDAGAMAHAMGAHQWILLVQFTGEVFIVIAMGQQLWVIVKSFGTKVIDAVQ